MVNERMYGLGAEPSAIRELFAYGMVRKAEIGAENVFDFSIGNPSVPAPDAVKQAVLELMDEEPSALHGYTPAAGDPRVRQAVADHIRRRYDVPAQPEQVYLTAGAAAGLAISISAVTEPGDEVIIIAPFFPEYKVWIGTAGCTCVEVPAHVPDFQLDIDALAQAIGPKKAAVILTAGSSPVDAIENHGAAYACFDVAGFTDKKVLGFNSAQSGMDQNIFSIDEDADKIKALADWLCQ